MTMQELVAEMLEFKENYPSLSVAEILKVFEIQAMKDLTRQIRIAGLTR